MRFETENDPEVLRQAALLLERENQKLAKKIIELTAELLALKGGDPEQLKLRIAELEQQIAQKNRLLFGEKSERRGGEAQDATPEPPPKPPQKGHGPKAQPSLPIVEVVHELDEADKVCNSCGGALEVWEGQFEESEEVDVAPRRFELKKHKRQKYRCRCGGCVETAPAPMKLFEGARYSIDFAVEVATEKYCDHAPLERQVRKMRREGLLVESQTLWDQIERLARLLSPGYEALVRHVLSHPVIGADETRWPLLGKNEPSRWHAWSIVAPDAVAYRILEGRSAEEAKQVLGGYEGTVMCDGYAVYKSLAKGENAPIKLAHCWAHVRREFIEAEKSYPEETKAVLGLIRGLYAVEAQCEPGAASDEKRRALRGNVSRPIIDRIREFAETTAVVPDSSLDKAIQYMAGMWSGLTRFLDDPRIPLDNNHTERAERGVVVGRKNHYGSRSKRGTEVAALFYSYVESAKLCGLDPKAYLRTAVMAALRGERIALPHEVSVER
ncbi:IS66 family transposase [Polyangium jinanense]|uniref:IS66 family transposase n=1 Tax=Polyangium jinanense TaxID=2829994 RepID=UPI00234233C3|nr:IS66 family transposase [Polyangium jinanense]MDC3956940.1 IS66 family transposase [Polyangium jinanense]